MDPSGQPAQHDTIQRTRAQGTHTPNRSAPTPKNPRTAYSTRESKRAEPSPPPGQKKAPVRSQLVKTTAVDLARIPRAGAVQTKPPLATVCFPVAIGGPLVPRPERFGSSPLQRRPVCSRACRFRFCRQRWTCPPGFLPLHASLAAPSLSFSLLALPIPERAVLLPCWSVCLIAVSFIVLSRAAGESRLREDGRRLGTGHSFSVCLYCLRTPLRVTPCLVEQPKSTPSFF